MDVSDRNISRKERRVAMQEFMEDYECHEIDTKLFPKDCCGRALHDFDPQSHEAWLMTVPKGMDPRELLDKRIKMPGRRYVGDIRVRATPYEQPLNEAVGYVNPRGKYVLSTLPLTGDVMISKRLSMQKPSADNPDEGPEASEPPKFKRAPLRHPFFGRDFKSRIEVAKEKAEELVQADKQNLETSARLRHTHNFYTIRSRLLATTKTLEEKEQEVRQSVLTGVRPAFMSASDHPDYQALCKDELVDLTNGDEDDVKVKEEPLSPKKRKQKVKEEPVTPTADEVTNGKRRKKRKANGEQAEAINGFEEVVEVKVEPKTEPVEVKVETKKKKKKD